MVAWTVDIITGNHRYLASRYFVKDKNGYTIYQVKQNIN